MENLLLNVFEQSTEYHNLITSVREGISPVLIHGSDAAVLKWAFEKLMADTGRPVIVCFDDDYKAKLAAEEVPSSKYLPTPEMVWFESFAHSSQTQIERTETLIEMAQAPQTLVFTSIQNLSYKYPTRQTLLESRLVFDMTTTWALPELQKTLFYLGYERVDIVEAKGQYAMRGGILDVFAVGHQHPLRVEFFGDDVDSIRYFDIESQQSLEKLESVDVYPRQELVLNADRLATTVETLQALKDDYDASRAEKIGRLLENLTSGTFVDGLDRYFSLIYKETSTLQGLVKDPIVCVIGHNATFQRLEQYIDEYNRQFADYLERGDVIKEQFGRINTFETVLETLKRETLVLNELLIKRVAHFEVAQIIKFTAREMNKYFGKFEQVAQDILHWKLKGYRVLIALSTEGRMDRFVKSMTDLDVIVSPRGDETRVVSGQALCFVHPIGAGFYFDTFKTVLLTENEIFGEGKRITRRKQTGKVIKAFTELKIGDHVVHENHGVGQYVGIQQVKIDQTRKDFIKIKYASEDYLYIPVESAGLIQKYIGTDKEKLKLNKLGGTEWKKTKHRAKKAIEEMTDELIELYAARRAKKGYAFSKDTEWQRDFEAMFPYQETGDQLKCIDEIKTDMEKASPMERLLCGDVGYGKTEVAMRAAFKAVMDSKQVAFLVPTTILAQQHYNNLKERFSKFPANIQVLSRFKTKAEQDKIIDDVKAGVVDVVVGTHRLLSKDVVFKDLGLLIVDEEQRFGVKHKERLKQLKENIDVLTLTATPIPRTLHMSMIGIRDMSVIEDPPEDRYPIQTYVVELDEHLVREAIIRELERGGQVYVVHNRVSDIDQVAAKIQKLIPDARIAYAHGQMNEHALEALMMGFMNHEYDVLVSTTIIETGLDISNVNTIIINDGDRFGLSQLYQLRGRVGRSNRLAYCYIFYRQNKVLNEVAEKRLKAIKEFTELGAGFKIAMRDLEIRGTGNVLGTAQHGHMEAVGYDLYCKMLEESMLAKKGEIVQEKPQAKIDFHINAYIPERYIEHPQLKIEMYKKIASIDTRVAYDKIYEEIEDRFGTVPTPVDNLMRIAYIKALCEQMGIEEIGQDVRSFKLVFSTDARISPLFISEVLKDDSRDIAFEAKTPAAFRIKITNALRNKEEQLKRLEKSVEKIYSFHSDYINH